MKRKIISLILIAAVVSTVLLVGSSASTDGFPFTDVKPKSWYYDAVHEVWEAGLINGKTPTTYGPTDTMTRAELVTLMARISGDDVSTAGEYAAKFHDVGAKAWHRSYVGWAVKNSIVNGYDGDVFKPDSPITRQELAAVIVRFIRYLGALLPSEPTVDVFADEGKIASWAKADVESLRLTGLVGGDNLGNFNPKKTVTRAEVAAIVARLHEGLALDPMYGRLDHVKEIAEMKGDYVLLRFGEPDTLTPEVFSTMFLSDALGLDVKSYEAVVDEAALETVRNGTYSSAAWEAEVPVSLDVAVKNADSEMTKTVKLTFMLRKDSKFSVSDVPEFRYKIKTDGTAEIVEYVGTVLVRDLTIPKTLDGYAVTSIGDGAFYGCRELKRVVIPEGIRSIGTNAFGLCTSLETVEMADTVEKAGRAAFYYCGKLKNVKLSENLADISDYMFYMDVSLDGIELPDSVDEIGMCSFGLCPIKSLTFGANVERIGDYAFEGAAITEIKIPATCKRIGSWAFYNCAELSSAELGGSHGFIGSGVFYGTAVKTVIYHGTVEEYDAIPEKRQPFEADKELVFVN